MLGRFLKDLEQGVEGGNAEHVDLVHDVDALFDAGGGEHCLVSESADIVYAVVGGGVYFDDVHNGAVVDAPASGALTAGIAVYGVLAVDGLGEDLGAAGLTGAAGADEEVGMRKAPRGDLRLERFGYMILTADLIEGSRPVFAVERLVDGIHDLL